jgi:DNA-binding transcriptional LysR family regulator
LLLSWAILNLLIFHCGTSAFHGEQMNLDLGVPRSTVTDAVKRLSGQLGVRLVQRTTRHVSPMLDAEAFDRRSLALIAELPDAVALVPRAQVVVRH